MKEVSGVTFGNGQTLRVLPTTVGLSVADVIVPWDEVADLSRYIAQTPRRNRVEITTRKRQCINKKAPQVPRDAMVVVLGKAPKISRGKEKEAVQFLDKLYKEYEAVPRTELQDRLSKAIKCTPVQARNLVSNLIHRQHYLGVK